MCAQAGMGRRTGMKQWKIQPLNPPSVTRHCSKCGKPSQFECSGNFRVNANGRNLDVWLIYQCAKCNTTWNMAIFSRVKPEQIEAGLYQAFLHNDRETAMRYAFDPAILYRNKAEACFDEVAYRVEKSRVPGDCWLEVIAPYDFNLRLDRLLSEELGLSRTRVKKLLESGRIFSREMALTPKTKVKGTIAIEKLDDLEENEKDLGADEEMHKAAV